ncbi:zinc finger protein 438 [Chanos chanos]|uniref:Zinc finger protein 438 n=1 Tax=Chanos chanos TaxID=29144 RepID=A0A6J2VHT2_CHACN|nr:zinc finger protein 438 [Chanos chanos]
MKGLQFRSIAPKAPAVVQSPTVLSCQPTSALPEASTAVSPKSILVPAQNYALMQVAGQEGTFSLVALPQSPQQQPVQKSLKLPIPRYQPMRGKSAQEKVSNKRQSPAKITVTTRARSSVATAAKTKPSESTESPDSLSEKVFLIDPTASSEISVATLLPDNAVLYPGSQTEQGGDRNTDSNQNLSYSQGPKNPIVTAGNNCSPAKLQTSKDRNSMTNQPGGPGGAITVLSPAIFSKAVQIIPSPPKGKLPILPYAKVKNSLLPPASLSNTQSTEKKLPNRAKTNFTRAADLTDKTQAENTSNSGTAQTKKPTGKRRGRKRKTMEDILMFEARKKRSLTFFRRRVPEKPPAGATDKLVDISRKYRTIRPKPMLVMETAIPQLVSLPSLSTPDSLDQEASIAKQISGKPLDEIQSDFTPARAPGQRSTVAGLGGGFVYTGSRPLHRCPTCSRCFQFKHHLQSHMNSHSNLRPYVCPVCRKAYAHSGSLSTHMKLHHTEGRPRKNLRCEFCEKAFGYVGVYFSHLREVHRVILTVEPSISQHEENTPVEGSADPDEQASERVDPVELQIKCGRCQAITPTFADMKLHLLYVHGEEVQVRLREGALRGGREAEDELVKHAAHYWRQLNEKRNLVRCGSCDEEFFSFSKLKRHLHSHHQRESQDEEEEEEDDSREEKGEHVPGVTHKSVILQTGSHFNCILCSEVFISKQDVLEHWRGRHHCENPALLWDVLDSRGRENDDTPMPSPN